MHMNMNKIGIFSMGENIDFSLVTDTIYIFTVTKQGFLGNFGTLKVFKIFKVTYICQK